MGGATGAAMGGAAEAAPAAISGARGLWARVAEPAAAEVQPALAGASMMKASARPTRIADRPAAGSIPPEYSPAIPKHDRPLVSESMMPQAEELADAADLAHAEKSLGRNVPDDLWKRLNEAREPFKPATSREVPAPTSDVRTVRPPRGKRAAGPKLPSEKGVSTAGDEQSSLSFPEDKSAAHWLEGELSKPNSETALKGNGVNPSKLATFGEGQRAVRKPAQGSLAMPALGIDAKSIPYREQGAHQVGDRLFGADNPVPKTVVKDFGRGPESLQEFVPDTTSAFKFEDPIVKTGNEASTLRGEDLGAAPDDYVSSLGPERTAEVEASAADPSHQRTFATDSVVGQIDRHGDNMLRRNADGSAVAIDNGYAFGKGPKGYVAPAVPYQNKNYIKNVGDFLPEVQNQIKGASLKGVAKDLGESGGAIKPSQVKDTLGRLRDLQYNPKQLKGLDEHGWEDWANRDFTQRNLPTSDLMEIEGRAGGIPTKHAPNFWFETPKLEGKALEGEQLSLTDLLNKLR